MICISQLVIRYVAVTRMHLDAGYFLKSFVIVKILTKNVKKEKVKNLKEVKTNKML